MDEQIKDIARRYNEIEGQLDRLVHYSQTLANERGDGDKVKQAWINEAGDAIKVSLDRRGTKERSLTEYYFSNNGLMFVRERTEEKRPDGTVHVSEARKYLE